MNRRFLPTVAAVLSLTALAAYARSATTFGATAVDRIEGSGRLASESRSLHAFLRIDDSTSADVNVTVSNAKKFSIQAEDNILPLIKTVVEGDTLHIRCDKRFGAHKPIRIEIATLQLNGMTLSGSGKFVASNIDTDVFNLDTSGSADVSLNGKATRISAELSGSGDLDARHFATSSAKIDLSGTGSASVNASKNLHAAISGSGSVKYLGQPKTETDISGSGKISRL
jgi:hypothetical protein